MGKGGHGAPEKTKSGKRKKIALHNPIAINYYVLALKDNHPTLHEDVTLWLNSEIKAGRSPVLENEIEKDHNRIEKRRYWHSDQIDFLENRGD